MNEFLLIFRRDFSATAESPEDQEASLKRWQDWFGSIAAQNKLARPLQRWDGQGRVVKADASVINGPYVEIKESIGGVITIIAEDYDEAAEIAKGCPVLQLGGNVEIRRAVTPMVK